MLLLDSTCRICMQQHLLLKFVQPKDETMAIIYNLIFKSASVQVCNPCEQELSRLYRFFRVCSRASDELRNVCDKDGEVYAELQDGHNVEVKEEFDSVDKDEETLEDLDCSCSYNCSIEESKDQINFGTWQNENVVHLPLKRDNDGSSNQVEVSLNMEKLHLVNENIDGCNLQFDEEKKIDIIDHEPMLVKEDPLLTSEQNKTIYEKEYFLHDFDSPDIVQPMYSLPKVVLPRIKCYTCSLCEETFVNDSARKRHERENHHNAEKTNLFIDFQCKQRSNVVDKPTQNSHLRWREYNGEKSIKCQVCGVVISKRSSLICHMRIHSGERPFKCELCGISFSQSGNLYRHMRVHSDERPYKCDECDRAYKERRHLNNHKLTHSNTRPFSCSFCKKAFFRKSSLSRHIRTHIAKSK